LENQIKTKNDFGYFEDFNVEFDQTNNRCLFENN